MARVSGTWPSHSAPAGVPTVSSLCRHAAPPFCASVPLCGRSRELAVSGAGEAWSSPCPAPRPLRLTLPPLTQDGSCNGLQHYAALGRDSVGAASVNLLPSDLPQDVYSEVAAQVRTHPAPLALIPQTHPGLSVEHLGAVGPTATAANCQVTRQSGRVPGGRVRGGSGEVRGKRRNLGVGGFWVGRAPPTD